MTETLPGAQVEWSFMERISGLDSGFISSLFETHLHAHILCPCECPCSHSCQKALVSPRSTFFCFQAIVCSFSISVHPAVDTDDFGNCWLYRTFLHGYRGRKISSSEKSSLGFTDRLRQGLVNLHLEKVLNTSAGRLSPKCESLPSLNCSIKNNMGESFQFNVNYSAYKWCTGRN